MNSSAATLSCPFCASKFKRQEHLDRHLHRHSGTRPFPCSVCSRSFPRRDTLRRHIATHSRTLGPDEVYALSLPTSQRHVEACKNCARSKQRCNRQDPCDRCAQKGLQCVYNSRSLARARNSRPATCQTEGSQTDNGFNDRTRVFDGSLHSGENHNAVNSEVFSSNENTPNATSIALTPPNPLPAAEAALEESGQAYLPEMLPQNMLEGLTESGFQDFSRLVDGNDGVSVEILPLQDVVASYPYPPFWMLDDFDNQVDFPYGYQEASAAALTSPAGADAQFTNSDSRQGLVQYGSQENPAFNRPRAIQSRMFMQFSHRDMAGPCIDFPSIDPPDHDIVLSENFCHVDGKIHLAYKQISDFHSQQRVLQGAQVDSSLPPYNYFHVFIQLYFEYFDPQLPLVHWSVLEAEETSWTLYLAIATIGCQYSAIANAQAYHNALRDILRRAVLIELPQRPERAHLSFAQSVVLHHVSFLFAGTPALVAYAHYDKGTLVALCRGALAKSDVTPDQLPKGDMLTRWRSWAEAESRRRLIHSIWYLECLCFLFHGLRTGICARDFDELLPCRESLWNARTATDWAAQHMPQPGTTEGNMRLRLFLSKHFPRVIINQHAGTFAKILIMMALFMEETAMEDLTRSWLFGRTISQVIEMQNTRSDLEFVSSYQAEVFLKACESSYPADAELDSFTPEGHASTAEIDNHVMQTTYHLLSILRRVRVETLYSISHWETTTSGARTARREFTSWVKNNPQNGRKCIWHAGMIFNSIRQRKHVAAHEPFSLLIAALFLWASLKYGDLLGVSEVSNDMSSCPDLRAVIRLDRFSGDSSLKAWIQGKSPGPIHITGLGVLHGEDSSVRVLKDMNKILASQTSWVQLSHGLVYAIEQLIQGKTPTYTPE